MVTVSDFLAYIAIALLVIGYGVTLTHHVVLGLIFLLAAGVVIWVWKKRRA